MSLKLSVSIDIVNDLKVTLDEFIQLELRMVARKSLQV